MRCSRLANVLQINFTAFLNTSSMTIALQFRLRRDIKKKREDNRPQSQKQLPTKRRSDRGRGNRVGVGEAMSQLKKNCKHMRQLLPLVLLLAPALAASDGLSCRLQQATLRHPPPPIHLLLSLLFCHASASCLLLFCPVCIVQICLVIVFVFALAAVCPHLPSVPASASP